MVSEGGALDRREGRAAAEKFQFDDEGAADDLAAELLYNAHCRHRGAAGGEQIVNDEDASLAHHAVLMNLQRGAAVFEVVTFIDGAEGELAGFAGDREADAEAI